jgi:hypothetical protein
MSKMKTTVQATAKTISESDQRTLLELPLYSVKEIQSYLKPGEGFERAAPVALDHLAAHPEIAVALHLDVAALKQELARGIHLAAEAEIAENLARHAQENRLKVESGVYRAILKLNRFVQNAESAELMQEFSVLSDWVASTHPGGGAPQPAPATPQPAPVVPTAAKSA